MSIEIRQLRYAVMTADAQSFRRAAAALNVKQSTERPTSISTPFGVLTLQHKGGNVSNVEAACPTQTI